MKRYRQMEAATLAAMCECEAIKQDLALGEVLWDAISDDLTNHLEATEADFRHCNDDEETYDLFFKHFVEGNDNDNS